MAAGWGLLAAATLVQLPALVLQGLRGDCSLLEAVYFCFNSLSTLGLGHLLLGGVRGLHPVLYQLGQLALLGEFSCHGVGGRGDQGRGAGTRTPIDGWGG